MKKHSLINQIEEVVLKNQMELVEVKIQSKKNPVIEITIYKPEGISLDDCTSITKEVESKIDLDSYFDSSYNLVVSSPGLDRKLTTYDDYRRTLGKMVEVRLYSRMDGFKELVGTLSDYSKEAVSIKIENEIKIIEIKNVALMKQYIDFGR